MATTIGMGDYVYEYRPDWARLPASLSIRGVSGVAVDSHDRVYVFQRQGPPVLVFDREGHFLAPWQRPDGVPADAHHIHVGPDDSVYLVDRDAHQVLKYTSDGELLASMGARDRASLQAPFNHPADICVAPSGELFVADGYGNSSVHRFAPGGDYITSFGSPGNGPGEFLVPHAVRVSNDGRVYVADRENNRVQVFTTGRRVLDSMDRLQVPDGHPHRRQPDGLRDRSSAPDQHPQSGRRASGAGKDVRVRSSGLHRFQGGHLRGGHHQPAGAEAGAG